MGKSRIVVVMAGCLFLSSFSFGMYNPEVGRFMQHDPHGINPAGGEINAFSFENQYADGLNIFQYAASNPLYGSDAFGLWGPDVHFTKTRVWAQRVGYPYDAALAVATANNAVDSGATSPFPVFGNPSYHFNRNPSGQEDSRIAHFRWHFFLAQIACLPAMDNPHTAAMDLGTSLHPLQDWVAHGDYFLDKPITFIHNQHSPQKDFGMSFILFTIEFFCF